MPAAPTDGAVGGIHCAKNTKPISQRKKNAAALQTPYTARREFIWIVLPSRGGSRSDNEWFDRTHHRAVTQDLYSPGRVELRGVDAEPTQGRRDDRAERTFG